MIFVRALLAMYAMFLVAAIAIALHEGKIPDGFVWLWVCAYLAAWGALDDRERER
jgi:hypothetical protein